MIIKIEHHYDITPNTQNNTTSNPSNLGGKNNMELYNYSLLLKTIKTINVNNVLLETDRVDSLRTKLALLENKLINSGILEDWYSLSEVIKESGANRYAKVNYARYNAPKMHIEKMKDNYIQFDSKARLQMLMSSGSSWSNYFGIDIAKCHNKGTLCWDKWDSTPGCYHGWSWFRDELSEYSTKIAIIEKIFEIYAEYRQHVLDVVAEAIADKIKKGAGIASEINNIKAFIIKEV